VILKSKPTGSEEDDNSTAAVDELLLSNTLSVEESHRDLLPSIDLSAEQDISTNISMVQLRTGTDLSNMESDLGTSTQSPTSTVIRRQYILSIGGHSLQSETTSPRPRSSVQQLSTVQQTLLYIFGACLVFGCSSFVSSVLILATFEGKVL
jgi:hypothetical protein